MSALLATADGCVQAVPSIHQRSAFAQEVRRAFLAERFDAVAVELPPSLFDLFGQGVEQLPNVTAVVFHDPLEDGEERTGFLPVDPCDSIAEAVRLARQERVPVYSIDQESTVDPEPGLALPDEYALRKTGLTAWYGAVRLALDSAARGSTRWSRENWMGLQLRQIVETIAQRRAQRREPGRKGGREPGRAKAGDEAAREPASEEPARAGRPPRVLWVGGLNHWEGVKAAYENHRKVARIPAKFRRAALYQVAPDSLYFLLGELPYATYLFEKSRYVLPAPAASESAPPAPPGAPTTPATPDTAAPPALHADALVGAMVAAMAGRACTPAPAGEWKKTDALKELLLATRAEYLRDLPEEREFLAPARLQNMLTYMRNLTLLKGRLTPDLYTIIVAAKGCGGGGFAAKTVEMAKHYPYLDPLSPLPTLRAGIGKLELPEAGVTDAQNFFPQPPTEWRNIPLRKLPRKDQKQKFAMRWNPFKQCSWPPEDEKIEVFRAHVFERALQMLGHEAAKVEKFSTSFKDGIDLRETLRNWHSGDIYVKELPPTQGRVDALVFLFDAEAGPHGGGREENKYPWKTVWFAEHPNESTLAFYATDWKENLIGPGIARARYGGCLFLFPPRHIPNLWNHRPILRVSRAPADILTLGALWFARERHVAVVSAQKPSLKILREARRVGKKIVHLPLSMFSRETLHRLRLVHVLNGKDVRSYAAKWIAE